MVGITLAQRDLAKTREQLRVWSAHKFADDVIMSELKSANRAAGWSSETLAFSVAGQGANRGAFREYVIRIPPAGGGMFPDYDLEGQTRTQDLLRRIGRTDHGFLRAPIVPSWVVEKSGLEHGVDA